MSTNSIQNNQQVVRKSAKSVDLAIKLALDELKLSMNEVDVTIISEGNKGFLGLGAKDACVEVRPKISKAISNEPDLEKPIKAVKVKSEPEKKVEISDDTDWTSDEIEAATESAKAFLTDLLASMNITADMNTSFENGLLTVSLTSRALGIIIGKRGETLDSIQYLTSLVVNRKSVKYIRISLDAENYRAKREEALVRLAQKLARKVKDSRRKYTLEPMNPYERRIIHASLQSDNYVTTYSIGEEPYRKVVIAPKR